MLGSSVDPERLALTIKGAIPLIVFVAAYFQFDIEATDLDEIITVVGMIASGAITAFGLVRKIINANRRS